MPAVRVYRRLQDLLDVDDVALADGKSPVWRAANGKHEYEVTAGTPGPAGPQGVQGSPGPTGPQGAAGTGVTMKGSVATSANLPASGSAQGDAYIVQADDSLWIWDGHQWVSGGSIQGPPGSQGVQGVQGPTGAQGSTGASGATGAAGSTGADGADGISAGKNYFFSKVAADVGGYYKLLANPSPNAETTFVTSLGSSGTGDNLIASFVTDPGEPGITTVPAGNAYRRLWAVLSGGSVRFKVDVYGRTAAGVEALLRSDYSPTFNAQTTTLFVWMYTTQQDTAVNPTDRLVIKLSVARLTGTPTSTVYLEGASHASHVQTTISTGAVGPAGPNDISTNTTTSLTGLLSGNGTNVGSKTLSPFMETVLDDTTAAAARATLGVVSEPIGWTWVTKAADESVASSTTLQNDDELFFTTANGATYEIELRLVFASPAGGGTPDINVVIAGEDATVRGGWSYIGGLSAADSSTSANSTPITNFPTAVVAGTATANRMICMNGWYGGGGGTVQVKWCQATSGASPTIVRAGSVLRYRRIV